MNRRPFSRNVVFANNKTTSHSGRTVASPFIGGHACAAAHVSVRPVVPPTAMSPDTVLLDNRGNYREIFQYHTDLFRHSPDDIVVLSKNKKQKNQQQQPNKFNSPQERDTRK